MYTKLVECQKESLNMTSMILLKRVKQIAINNQWLPLREGFSNKLLRTSLLKQEVK